MLEGETESQSSPLLDLTGATFGLLIAASAVEAAVGTLRGEDEQEEEVEDDRWVEEEREVDEEDEEGVESHEAEGFEHETDPG